MNKLIAGPALAVLVVTSSAGAAFADEVSLNKDLTSVIALQGLPCGEVIKVDTQGDRDYVATCQNGSKYHVFVNPQGRVVAQKQ